MRSVAIMIPSLDETQDLILAHQVEPADIGEVVRKLHDTYASGTARNIESCATFLQMAAGLLRDDVRTFWKVAGTRPVLSPHLMTVARPLWQEKWDQHKDDACPVCLTEHGGDDVWDGPMNSDIPTRCNHWLCTACWDGLVESRPDEVRCPVCREDVTDWAARYCEVHHQVLSD